MYVILMYDILMDEGGAKVQRKTFKTCKQYLTHIQNSVFEGNLSDLNLFKLKKELAKFIRVDKDSFIIFKSRDEKWLSKEFWGIDDDNTSNFF